MIRKLFRRFTALTLAVAVGLNYVSLTKRQLARAKYQYNRALRVAKA
jgi:hypothetical protein